MAEAEDVITDVARHATVFARDLWRRHRAPPQAPVVARLEDFAQRIDLLIAAVFGASYPIRIAQSPAPTTLLTKLLRRDRPPRLRQAVPATDGSSIWLPAICANADHETALERYRTAALQQAMRAQRGSAGYVGYAGAPAGALLQDAYLLVEANAADEALARSLPGMAGAINRLRRDALAARPRLDVFAAHRLPFERRLRSLLESECGRPPADFPPCASPAESLVVARRLLEQIVREAPTALSAAPASQRRPLLRDWWTGELRPQPSERQTVGSNAAPQADDGNNEVAKPKSARLARRPEVRQADDDEDDERQGAFMIQTSQPHEHAEDPAGLQRPTDRDEESAAEDFAESVADLPEARLVVTPGRPKEYLLSDDTPRSRRADAAPAQSTACLSYPEWDYRLAAYRDPGATVQLLQPALGPQQWVDQTLATHRRLGDSIRRRFEMLRAEPMRLRRQVDGEEIDLESYVESHADFHAGLPMTQALYQTQRRARRSMAIMLLVDVSGSTDGWVGADRRVIDVEREALLLVCLALESMAEPYSVQSFSGEGPQAVSVRSIKRFDEPYGNPIARRIAALEPEHYTRAGAAIRHASSLLMAQRATHRLLLLSDGKPNDVDVYEGRYGIEDTRQAVAEARLQGVFPFCLTVDRQAGSYMPAIFGPGQYGLLPRPELLPMVLLEWMKRLVST